MNENARKLLKGYNLSKTRIDMLSHELGTYSSILEVARTAEQEYDCDFDIAAIIDRIETIIRTLDREIHKEEFQSGFVLLAISAVSDPEARQVLEYHYLAGMSLEKIAEELHYCLKTIKNRHQRGLAEVERYLLEDEDKDSET